MLKDLAIKLLKSLLAVAFLTIVLSRASYSEEKMCLDREGFIYPLISETKCENKEDEKINLNEYRYVRDFDRVVRSEKLTEYRINAKTIELEKTKKIEASLPKVKDKENLTVQEKRKIELEQKKLARLAKRQKLDEEKKAKQIKRLEQVKKRKAAKREKWLARQEEIKQKKLAALIKKNKLQEEKRIKKGKKLEELKIRQELQREKFVAKQEEIKQKKLAKEKEELAKKEKWLAKLKEPKKLQEEEVIIKIQKEKSDQKTSFFKDLFKKDDPNQKKKIKTEEKKELIVNNNLKVIYFDKKIVKNELFPSINSSSEVDFSTIENLDKNYIKNLFASNSNLILIIPQDYDSFSNVVSENERSSQVVAGVRQVPNPEFNKLTMRLRNVEREMGLAEREYRRAQSYSTNYDANAGWLGIFSQYAGLAAQTRAGNEYNRLSEQMDDLINQLGRTPDYLDQEVLRNYNYVVQNIRAEKKAIYKIVQSKEDQYLEKRILINKNKDFKVAYNIDPQDKNYASLLDKYSLTSEVTNWQNRKLKNQTIELFIDKINNENLFKEIPSKRKLYASLGTELELEKEKKSSFWGKLFGTKLFGTKKEGEKTASLNTTTSVEGYEIKDKRFDSVVIINTEKGLGSGFFIRNDEILTNYHVIENASSIFVVDRNEKRSSAVVIKKDLKRDLAILKTNTSGVPVEFFNGQIKQGEMVEALGHPKGRKFSLTKGWVSAIRKEGSIYNATGQKDVLYIQTDAAINEGNSGGPLFYKNKVVGVNTQGLSKDVSEGMNFAIHFSEVQQFIKN
jgi:S1-C subfamily serine protease